MTLPLTLPTTALEHPAMDYAFLRQEGLRLLERLGGQVWTDFNTHDPGITILEQLCYAITDLAYRTNFDIKDLLASGEADPYRSLHTPAQVLTTNPVTLTDLRKLLIDVPGVKNVWLEPVEMSQPGLMIDPSENILYLKTTSPQPSQREPVLLRGVYRVLIEADSSLALHASDILPEVNRRLYSCRCLAEDFIAPLVLPGQGIGVNAGLEISAVDDPEQLLGEIYAALARSISPRVHFHSLNEMLDLGMGMDEIMDGPALQHGFIQDAELENFERKIGLRTSDLIQAVMNVEGVLTINSISMTDGARSEDWYLKLDPLRTPYLDIDNSLFNSQGPTIRMQRSGLEVPVKPARVGEILNRLLQADIDLPLLKSQRDVLLPPGLDRHSGRYDSIQNQFPAVYGIGAIGLPDSASALRQAQARQLKAYLLFFDQLLANSFAQLEHVKDLFSFYASQPATYFSQIISDEGLGLDEIRVGNLNSHAARVQEITETTALGLDRIDPDDPAISERKNRFLNHLLARFAEQFTDYSLLMYANISNQDLIEDKNAFLRNYNQIGASRGSGFNYTQPSWGTENVSGLEKRISLKLGISSYSKRDLAGAGSTDDGGFHMLEHILLRPNLADQGQWAQAVAGTSWQADAFVAEPASGDPYSHQLSFIFPKWVDRFAAAGFSDLIEKTVREETPAHIRVNLLWLDQAGMLAFETAYKTWLDAILLGKVWSIIDIRPDDDLIWTIFTRLRDARDQLVQLLGLGLPYPLRDLKLDYPPLVAYNLPTKIQIRGGQSGVLYQLCDEDGNPVVDQDSLFQVIPDDKMASEGVFLPTPVILQDITFTVMAVREDPDRGIRLETYLNQVVSLQVGINTGLPVAFSPASSQVGSGNQIIVNYGDTVAVTVANTQEGISYKLILGPQNAPVNFSDPQKGNLSSVSLVSNQAINEDIQISVLAYRTAATKVVAVLTTTLTILVRPNPALAVQITPPIVDYNASSILTLVSPQSSVEYRLFKRDLSAAEYLGSEAGSLIISTDEGRRIFINPPQAITNWDAPAGFSPVAAFAIDGTAVSASTGSLAEDTLFIIQATKTANQERLQLSQAVAILVRPDPAPVVGVQNALVASGQPGLVTLDKTQKGVSYQLRLDADNTPVNLPGYDLRDRALETMRVEVDLVVEEQGQPLLLLPTQAITQATSFNILASKILTGVSAQLTGKAEIDISPPAGG